MTKTTLGIRKATTNSSISWLSCAVALWGIFAVLFPNTAVALDWTARNGPEGGTVAHIAVDSTNSNIAYLSNWVTTYKTTNGGTSWTDLKTYFGASKIVLDPTNHSIVYVVGGILAKSTDAGANWTVLLNTNLACGDGIRTLVMDPKNSNILYGLVVKTGNPPDYYVIKSTDGGTNWTKLSWKAITLAIDPSNTSIMYATTTAGVQKSTDGGTTWSAAGTGLPTGQPLGTPVIDPKTTATIYLQAGNAIYKTTNSGGQWQNSSTGLDTASISNDPVIDPITPNNLYVVGTKTTSILGTVYKSTNGGGQWNALDVGISTANVQSVTVDPSNPVNLYAATLQNGVLKSLNGGTSWATKNTGILALVQYMVLDPSNKNLIYVGIPGEGVFVSSDGGSNWSGRNTGLGSPLVTALAISPVGSHILWVAINSATVQDVGGGFMFTLPGIYKSTNGGSSWSLTELPTDSFSFTAPMKLVADPVDPDGIYALGVAGVYHSTDGGNTWTSSKTGLSASSFGNALVINPQDPTILYLGTFVSTAGVKTLYKSMDSGATWSASSNGLPNTQGIYDLAIDPKTPSTIYAAVISSTTVNGGVFKSVDSGGSWQDMTSGVKPLIQSYTITPYPNIHFTGTPFNCPSPFLIAALNLAIDVNTPTTLFAVVDGIILRTTDGGSNWALAQSGLPSTSYQIGISPADGTAAYVGFQGTWVYTGTGGSGGGGGGGGGGSATVTVTSPNGGESWAAGSTHNITWNNNGTVGNVHIDYSTDGGTTWSEVAHIPNSGSSGSYSWTVPNTPSTTVKVRVHNDSGSISDTSDANFTISTSGGGGGGGGGGGLSSDLFVPVVLSTSGVGGSFFTTELTFTLLGTSTANVDLSYTATTGGGTGTASTTIPPGQSVFSNGIDYMMAKGVPIPGTGNRVGTLRAHVSNLSSASDASITARTTTAVAGGRAGLAYPGITVSNGGAAAISQGKDGSGNQLNRVGLAETGTPYSAALTTTSYVCGLRQNATDRSNVAFQNAGAAGAGSITLQVTVFDGNSSFSQVLPLIVLEPGAFNQISGVLASNGLSLTNGYVKVERTSGTAPYYAYGVVNDQVNSDGSFLTPQPASTSAVTGLTLPVIVQTTTFISEVVLANFSGQARTINFTFVADAITTADKTAHFSINIPAGQQQIISDIFAYMRNNAVAGIGPAGTTIAGALFATATGGDISGVVLGARTSAAGGTVGGRFGLFYTAVPYGQASTTSAWVFGLQQNSENRTNLAIVNTGETDASDDTFVIDLYDGATGNLVKSLDPIVLKAKGWIQIGTILNSAPGGVQQGYARVRRTAGNNPFITYAVINDGAGPGQRTGDGAFIGSSQ